MNTIRDVNDIQRISSFGLASAPKVPRNILVAACGGCGVAIRSERQSENVYDTASLFLTKAVKHVQVCHKNLSPEKQARLIPTPPIGGLTSDQKAALENYVNSTLKTPDGCWRMR